MKPNQLAVTTAPHGGVRIRVSVAAIFALNGFLMALWVAHIPVILIQTDTRYDQLGGLLLLLGGCAFVGMQLAGPILDRYGSRPGTIVAGTLLCVAIVGPVSVHTTAALAVAVGVLGFVNGFLDVSMNAQAVQIERSYARPIMSSFHGFFSAGGLLGALIVAATLRAEVGVVATVVVAGTVGLVGLTAAAPGLASRDFGREVPDAETPTPSGSWWREVNLRRLSILALIAFLLMLSEGTAYDWSHLHVVDTHNVREDIGAIAFGAFSAAMTVTRFLIDPIAARVGPVLVVRVGASVGIAGMTLAVAAPTAWLAIVGWGIFGIGVAGLVPQIFTAAGNLSERASGRAISLVVGCGYLGLLAGPAIVGPIAERTTLGTGLMPVFAALLVAVVFAGVVRPPRPRTPLSDP